MREHIFFTELILRDLNMYWRQKQKNKIKIVGRNRLPHTRWCNFIFWIDILVSIIRVNTKNNLEVLLGFVQIFTKDRKLRKFFFRMKHIYRAVNTFVKCFCDIRKVRSFSQLPWQYCDIVENREKSNKHGPLDVYTNIITKHWLLKYEIHKHTSTLLNP